MINKKISRNLLILSFLPLLILGAAISLIFACGGGGGGGVVTQSTPEPTNELAVNTTAIPEAVLGAPYHVELEVTGGVPPYTWSIAKGTLPPGLALNSSKGIIEGTPSSLASTTEIIVAVTDQKNVVRQMSLTISVGSDQVLPLKITSGALADGYLNTQYSATVSVSGGSAPYTWLLTSGFLHSGLTFNTKTGQIAGSPTETGTKSLTITVTDAAGVSVSVNLTLTVSITPLTVATTSISDGVYYTTYSYTLTATGGAAPYTYSITGTLPAGLSLDSSTGIISGLPAAAGVSNITVKVTDSTGATATKNLSIKINYLSITTTTLPDTQGLTATSIQLATAGTTTKPLVWSVASGALPDGLTLNTSTGLISGTPYIAGNFIFTIKVTDGTLIATRDFAWNILGNFWLQINPTGTLPTARNAFGMAYMNNKIYVFGGNATGGARNDLWVYDFSTNAWTQLSPTGGPPGIRLRFTMVAIINKLYVFGGDDGTTAKNDLWVYDAVANTWTQLTPTGGPPTIRTRFTAVAINNKLYMFGGDDNAGTSKNDLWVYDPVPNTWTQLAPTGGPPGIRNNMFAAVINNKMYLFGGNNAGTYQNDIWVYDPVLNTWTLLAPLGTPPPGRIRFVAGGANNKLYIFGGTSTTVTYLSDCWQYDTVTNIWTQLTPAGTNPSGRYFHSAIYFNNLIYIFGGYDADFKNDLWKYSP